MSNMELLAPAGSVETFGAAIDSGADAIYVGAPGFNARNLARDLRLEEIGAMISRCHRLGKKLYIAANSLVLEKELPLIIESLALLQELQPDALIVQDLGVMRLVRNYFPGLTLHGSTLTTVHNSDGVRFQADLGCERVVLARELTLKEIETIASRSGGTELEIFIHGAMCFSYSGLCLFSSYLGGKSSLRGRCVQPCRRAYTAGSTGTRTKGKGKKGDTGRYLFSMNDLNGLEAVPFLRELGISSLKIEGRLRSPHYVRCIVGAYRKVLDAGEGEEEKALQEAQILAEQAMSRKTSPGYFFSPQPPEAITPYHSGNLGVHLGRFTATRMVGEETTCRFITKANIAIGDRVRIHVEPSGERTPFRLKSLFVAGEQAETAETGTRVSIGLPADFQAGGRGHVELYKVDGALKPGADGSKRLNTAESKKLLANKRKQLAAKVGSIVSMECAADPMEDQLQQLGKKGHLDKRGYRKGTSRKKLPLDWWLKTSSAKLVIEGMEFMPDRYLLTLDKQTVSQAGKIKKTLGKRSRLVTWVLSPLIMENDLPRYRKQINLLLRSGFRSFQLSHVSQVELFGGERVHLFGDYTLNLMNNQAANMLIEIGVEAAQAAIEMDRPSLKEMVRGYKEAGRLKGQGSSPGKMLLGLTVYGAPPLYTSRLAPDHFQFERQIQSPRKEPYIIKKGEGFTQTYPTKPFSLLPYLGELKEIGLDYVVVDTCGTGLKRKDMLELGERLNNSGRYSKLSTFNYLGKLE